MHKVVDNGRKVINLLKYTEQPIEQTKKGSLASYSVLFFFLGKMKGCPRK
jgi:hypothetical protein